MAFENFYKTHQFSVNHPERRPGARERWWMNDAVDDNYTGGYKSLRIGRIAYDAEGLELPGLRPLFLCEEEFVVATRLGPPHEDLPIEDLP